MSNYVPVQLKIGGKITRDGVRELLKLLDSELSDEITLGQLLAADFLKTPLFVTSGNVFQGQLPLTEKFCEARGLNFWIQNGESADFPSMVKYRSPRIALDATWNCGPCVPLQIMETWLSNGRTFRELIEVYQVLDPNKHDFLPFEIER